MLVTLLSNNPHYHHTAEALAEAGLLHRYYTSWSLLGDEQPPRYFPRHYRAKLEGRRLAGAARERVTQIRLPETLQKALPRLGICSNDTANDINNWLFDRIALRSLGDSEVFHFVNTLGTATATEVRRRGGLVVCDSRQEHPLAQNDIVTAEAGMRGLAAAPINPRLTRRMLQEYEDAHYIIVPSSFAKRTFVERGIDAARVLVVPYGVDPAVFPKKSKGGKRPETFTALYVGSLSLRKGVLYLLEAVRRLKLKRFRLLCIGDIEPDMKRLLIPYAGLFDHLQNVPKVELRAYYQSADVFVLPSLADSFGLVVLEAVATGLPVITTTNVGSCDVLENGKSGFVVGPGDVDALAESIQRLYDSPSLVERMSDHNRSISSMLTWGNYKASLLRAYNETIVKNRRHANPIAEEQAVR